MALAIGPRRAQRANYGDDQFLVLMYHWWPELGNFDVFDMCLCCRPLGGPLGVYPGCQVILGAVGIPGGIPGGSLGGSWGLAGVPGCMGGSLGSEGPQGLWGSCTWAARDSRPAPQRVRVRASGLKMMVPATSGHPHPTHRHGIDIIYYHGIILHHI